MGNIETMNEKYGIAGQVTFSAGQGDMPMVEVKNALGEASIGLQGAHVLGFQAAGEEPLIWMSPEATFAPGKSLRGGVPICWPWFGPHASDSSLPGHGPARTVEWMPVASQSLDDGRTRVSFELVGTDKSREQCGHDLNVQLHVTVGCSLLLEMETTNKGRTPFTLGEAVHTYFLVGDVRLAHIDGLDGCEYIDKMDGGVRKQQQGAVNISEETDRIYLGSGNRQEIIDPAMGRKIVIQSQGSASTVVWNPWIETANKMGDLGPDGYLHMLCVETVNAADDVVEIAPGASYRMAADYSSEAL
ncbi:MAG: D-hexose-6-phosphate mutarotase [Mariprofundaceae bacterium]|nr:D-hexose-6-phosphate mutarotase [Mariprofundaceae bacterium]